MYKTEIFDFQNKNVHLKTMWVALYIADSSIEFKRLCENNEEGD